MMYQSVRRRTSTMPQDMCAYVRTQESNIHARVVYIVK
jgi:hypothetical protein